MIILRSLVITISITRKNRARNTNVSHGGVSVLISNNVAYTYCIVVEECQVEGLVIIKLKHKITCQNITIICAYIPPINSTWNNADEIIQAIITYLYSTADHGKIFLCGDFNARTGALCDYEKGLDMVAERVNVDKIVNNNGESLIELLKRQ